MEIIENQYKNNLFPIKWELCTEENLEKETLNAH